MKQNIYRAMAAFFMVAGAAQAQNNVLQITETAGDTLLGITATYNGSPVTVSLSGPADNWTIELPNTFSLGLLNRPFFVGEPESLTTVNVVTVTQPTFLTWQSDILPPPGAGGQFRNPVTIPHAGTFLGGTAPQPFGLVLADNPVTEVSSTAALCGLALLGLCGVARFGRVRHAAA